MRHQTLQLFFRSKQKRLSMAQDSCQMGTRAALVATTRTRRTPHPRRIALRIACLPCEQGTHAHDRKISRTANKFTSTITPAISLPTDSTEFSRYDRTLWNVERALSHGRVRALKTATPAVEKARSMGRVDRHDVKVKSPERRRALARAEVRLRARNAAPSDVCAVSLSSHYSPRAARHIPKHSRAARLPS